MTQYDDTNIFAKILRGEIPCTKVYENDHVLAFEDVNPQRKVHVLVIPKGAYVSLDDFSATASEAEQAAFVTAIGHVAREVLGLAENGWRTILNTGAHGGQEVPHLHAHILGGEKVGPMTS